MKEPYEFRIDVETDYVDQPSDPASERYVFAYTISIHNQGLIPAQLLTRHWIITDANGRIQEVRGDGVVGEQPYIEPGHTFRYSSGAILDTPVGSMHGSYQMVTEGGDKFDAEIGEFALVQPHSIQ